MLTSGHVLDGRYRLVDQIATGGMGEVWRAVDTILDRVVAVKVLRSGLHDANTFGARFRAEARTMAALHHPGVVDVYDYGEISQDDGSDLAYLVMAYIDGEPLSHQIASAGHLSPIVTMGLVAQAAEALHAAHGAGIIHRDVKPDNLLIHDDERIVLVDFGVARTVDTEGLTGVGDVIGTARYMAPEQISKQAITPATDVYALGAVTYHCLAGQPPFTGDSAISVALNHLYDEPPPLPDTIPSQVRDVVTTAMAKDPADRYPSAAAMAAAATAARSSLGPSFVDSPPTLLAARGVATDRAGTGVSQPTQELQRPASRRGLAAALVGVVVALGAVGLALALTLPHTHNASPSSNSGTVPTTAKPSHAGQQTTPGTTATSHARPPAPRPTASHSSSGPTPSPSPSSPTATSTAPGQTAAPSSTPTDNNGGGGPSAPPSNPAGGDASPAGAATTAHLGRIFSDIGTPDRSAH